MSDGLAEVQTIASAPLARWAVFAIAAAALVVVVVHVESVRRSDMPASRRRIRLANGWLMLFTVPVIAAGFIAASPASPRLFVMVWMVAIGLVGLILMLACLDMLNTYRLARQQRRELIDQLNEVRRRLLESAAADPRAAQGPRAGADARPSPEAGSR